ncbi:hypothetical protein PSTT_09401, partial [Puccinia striiformis]
YGLWHKCEAKHHGQQPSSLTTSRSQNPWRNGSKLYLQPLRLDRTSVHALFSLSIQPNEHTGTLRYNPKNSKIGRIALLPAYRCSGIGKQMMISFERSSLSLPDSSTPVQLCLHSQLPVIGFYSKVGYEPVGPTFIGKCSCIPSRLMLNFQQ